jgi:outer membrane autotransporter protein
MQTAWYDTSGYVEDHVYGNEYPQNGGGGGGADLPSADASISPPTAASSQQSSMWGRISGNWSQRDTSVEETAPPLTFDTGLNQNTYNITGGVEFRPQGGDSEMRLGVFGGYLQSNVSFDSYGATSKSSGGLVGGYAAWIKGPWYLDAEVKADILSVAYNSPSVSASTNALSIGVLANTGYRMDNGTSFFEPIASFGFVNTSLGDTSGGGASIDYSNGQSIRVGLGARVGTTFGAAGGNQTELDLLGKVWDEFGGPNKVTVTDGVNTDTFTDSISGITGEVVGRATIYNSDRSASGFVSVGGKFGAGSTSVSAKAGLRKNF